MTLKLISPCDWLIEAMTTSSNLAFVLIRGELVTNGDSGEPGWSLTTVMLMVNSLSIEVGWPWKTNKKSFRVESRYIGTMGFSLNRTYLLVPDFTTKHVLVKKETAAVTKIFLKFQIFKNAS